MNIDVSPRALIEWIGDRTDEYTYTDNDNCALAQYLKSLGLEDVSVSAEFFAYTANGEREIQPIPGEMVDDLVQKDFADLKAALQQLLIDA